MSATEGERHSILFVGVVVLALGYRLLTAWLEMETGEATAV